MRAKERTLIARAKGSKFAQLLVEFEIHVLKIQHRSDVKCCLRLFVQDVVCHISFKSPCKLWNVLCRKREPSCIWVSAKVFQQVHATLNGFVDVKSSDRACRPRSHIPRARQHHGWTIVLFGHARSHNANDAFVPDFVVDHNGASFLQSLHLTHLLGGLFRHLSVKVFARLVVEVDVRSLLQCHLIVLFHQELHGFFRILHTSRSVDARANFENDIVHREFAIAQPTNFDDGL